MGKDIERRAKALAELVEEASFEFCRSGCGQPYPDVAAVVCGHLVVASCDASKDYSAPCLAIYTPKEVNDWLTAIREYQKENPEESIDQAVRETCPHH